MPHVMIEYSANLEDALDLKALIDDLHATAMASGLFDLDGIRTRAMRRDHYRIADGNPANGFVQITSRLAKGRPAEKRKELADKLLEAVDRRMATVYPTHPSIITVEVHEIDPEFRVHRNVIRERRKASAA